jgi:BirA family transcriptional regulator, biotin operon repressor / biotin---[acetyl-CoA-carboxylase] ligase
VTDERATLDPWRVEWVTSTGSTNADLAARARNGEPAGAVLVTDHQTAGRGRLDRAWEAPPGASLLVSVLLTPHEPLPAATHTMALAAVDACLDVAGVMPELKWPNDLMIGPRKLAGILAEAVMTDGRISGVVVGMGLNVNWPPAAELPGELAERVVALNHVAGRTVDRRALFDALLRHLAVRVRQWSTEPSALHADYRARLATLGRSVRVELADRHLEGVASDLTADGRLIVATAGEQVAVSVGDVVHLRSS